MSENKKKFVILEGIEEGNRFFTDNVFEDHTKSASGETWYRVLGYADTVEEAQEKLYGKRVAKLLRELLRGK